MRKNFLWLSAAIFLLSCANDKEKAADATETGTVAEKSTVELPYKATYSSSFTTDVSDADLKMVLNSYKDWSAGNMEGLANSLADSVEFDASDGSSHHLPKAELMKLWTTYRDSLSSVAIEMYAWHKMYASDKKEGHVVTWYKETDIYKNGKIDSATYHDINRVEDGKITWYSTMKRGFKKK
jgi:ketosteroid isomerase-like protein